MPGSTSLAHIELRCCVVPQCILSRCFPALVAVWRGQAKTEPGLLNLKKQTALLVIVSELTGGRILPAEFQQPIFERRVMCFDVDDGVLLIKVYLGDFLPLG